MLLLEEPSSHSQSTALIEKMVSNQGWSEDRLQTQQDSMHTVEETDMLAAKLDLVIKRLDKKRATYGTVQALNSHMTCEVYGNIGQSGNDCPKTH